jgi:hypothetical protein
VKEFGKPAREAVDGEPAINAYGIAIFPNGKQFVQDCVTGKIIERTPEVRYIGRQGDFHFYAAAKSKYTERTHALPSFAERKFK